MCAKRRQFEPEHAEDLRRSAIFIKYTVGCFDRESVKSLNRDDVAMCREIGGRDWIVTADNHKSPSVRALCTKMPIEQRLLQVISPLNASNQDLLIRLLG